MTTDKVNFQRKRERVKYFFSYFFIFKYLQTSFNFKTLNIL